MYSSNCETFLLLLNFPSQTENMLMERRGEIVIVRNGVRRRDRAKMRGMGRLRQEAVEGAVAFAEGLRTS